MKPIPAFCLFLTLVLGSWSSTLSLSAAPIRSFPYEASRSRPGQAPSHLYTRLGPEFTRIEYAHRVLDWHPKRRLYASSFAGGATCIGDLDLDGLPDLFLSGGPGANKLYLQAENLVFVDVTGALQLSDGELWASGSVLVDIDNDFDLDIYVCYYDHPNRLYRNQMRETGSLWFQEEAASLGLDIADASLVPAFADYDRDGDLDLYLLTHRLFREGGRPSSSLKTREQGGTLTVVGEEARYYRITGIGGKTEDIGYTETGRPDRFLRNDGGTFVDVTTKVGIPIDQAIGNSVIWWDYNEDGYPDLYVGNDAPSPDRLFENQKDGAFQEVTKDVLPHTSRHSTGLALLDANQDGKLDLISGDRAPSSHFKRTASSSSPSGDASTPLQNRLFLQTGGPRVQEVARLVGLHETDWTSTIKSGDFDQDGIEDLLFANGAVRNFSMRDLPQPTHEELVGNTRWDLLHEKAPEKLERNAVFRGIEGGLQFQETAEDWGLTHQGITTSAALGDLDNDGDLDLVMGNLEEPVIVYRNEGSPGNSIRIRLKGTESNSFGIGAKLTLTTPSATQVRELRIGSGFVDGDQLSAHFGIGPYSNVQHLRVDWPSGIVQSFTRLAANRVYVITETGSPEPRSPSSSDPWFVPHQLLESFGTPEAPYDDWKDQPFLPFQLSRTGPSQAWGDVDGNGALDLYIGGSTWQAGWFVYNNAPPDGGLKVDAWSQRAFRDHIGCEDTASVFLDADSDGDLDLFIGSGGVEGSPDSEVYQDRLFINQFKGRMNDETDRLPQIRSSTSCVSVADFDRDGDVDLFVGSRSIPGNYGLPADGYLLQNDKGMFTDVTADLAPQLTKAGMLTSSVWTDIDSDGWLDLIIAQEWGPLLVFRNEGGLKLTRDDSNSLSDYPGCWQAVSSADLDNDGDL
ncbi:MAG: VCBS repeat-containing protein, partial [Verrucomicrobiota bacterium]